MVVCGLHANAFRRLRSLWIVLASFALGQVTTSVVISYGPDSTGSWLLPLVNTGIAAFLVYYSIENIVAKRLDRSWSALGFGSPAALAFRLPPSRSPVCRASFC
jgi:hypothetical protein